MQALNIGADIEQHKQYQYAIRERVAHRDLLHKCLVQSSCFHEQSNYEGLIRAINIQILQLQTALRHLEGENYVNGSFETACDDGELSNGRAVDKQKRQKLVTWDSPSEDQWLNERK